MEYIFSLRNIPQSELHFIGGKALSLHKMMVNINALIPDGFVLTSKAISDGQICSEANEELETIIRSLDDSFTYAVRSSALNEDGDNSSFAGQYETRTDVKVDDIMDAVNYVISSAQNDRVKKYTDSFGENQNGIAVVIQKFVKPSFAGVIFTSDPITGDDNFMIGNYVEGEGEGLVSGEKDAKEFRFTTSKYGYSGSDELKKYAKTLYSYSRSIRKFYGMPMDIEWAISEGKVYILQARSITTLKRLNMETYEVNGSKSSLKLLTKTNVGEIFMKPVTPMTFSSLERINSVMGIPEWLDNIYGQPYMNVSVMCSMLVSFGMSEEKAYAKIKDLAGNLPEGIKIPLNSFDKKSFRHNLRTLMFPKNKSKLSKKEKLLMVEHLDSICNQLIEEIRTINTNKKLIRYWNSELLPKLNDGLSSILGVCGLSIVPLFGTRQQIEKIAGEEMANRLCGGCVGIIDCMKPMLLIEDVIEGKITADEYRRTCGHRSINEMELMEPRPYENPDFPQNVIENHKLSGINVHEMQKKQEEAYKEALVEFKEKYPNKSRWIDNRTKKFVDANVFREDIRSKGVWIFSVFREFMLSAGRINNLGDDIFMLTVNEVFDLLRGDRTNLKYINKRKETYKRYLEYPSFPSVVLGRFDPDIWMEDENRRTDFYAYNQSSEIRENSTMVKGFPGAFGQVRGKVRVITSIDDIGEIEQGEILVATATNIGWTLVFPKVSAIITDIGAPLSHAAIVAREFGIPAIVGCGNATTVLKTGDMVTVDGAKGIAYKD